MTPTRYDIYVQRDGGWNRLESMPGDDKDSAVARGAALDANDGYEGVRIMAVVEYGQDRPPLETLTWISPHLSNVASVTRQMRQQAEVAERIVAGRQDDTDDEADEDDTPAQVSRPAAPSEERTQQPARRRRPAKAPKPDSAPHLRAAGKMATGGLIAAGIAAVAFVPVTSMVKAVGPAFGLGGSALAQASFGITLLIFLVAAAVLMGRVYREYKVLLQTLPEPSRQNHERIRDRPRRVSTAAAAPPAMGDDTERPSLPTIAPESVSTSEGETPAPPKTGGLDEGMRRHMLEFLALSLAAIKDEIPTVNRHVAFGLNLFISGAAERYGQHAQLSPMQSFVLIREMVEALGNSADRVDAYCRQYAEYKAQERYRLMIQAGQTVMGHHIARDRDPFEDFSEVIKMWTSDAAARAQVQGIVCIMFTDIVGSTQITHERGDYGAQALVRVHNAVVRTSLAAHRGREVKHTGDGIMASFASSANAARCAVEIQTELKKHNATEGALPVNVRIGLNAGEAVEEEDDFFGTTVQVSARVCDKAGTGEVFVTDNVRELAKDQGITFEDAGQYEMKGVPQPMTLFRATKSESDTQ